MSLFFIAIVIVGVVSLSAMMLLRVMIKYLYNQISNIQSKRETVIVLGSAINSISLANTLRNEVGGHFDPVALLSLNQSQKYSNVNGFVHIFLTNLIFIFKLC